MNNPDPTNPNIKLPFAEKTINDFLRLEPLIQTTSPFYDLPPETILYWLQQLNLQGDSESSVFSILVQWLNRDPNRYQYFPQFLSNIRFHQIHKYYLLTVLPSFISDSPHLSSPMKFLAEQYLQRAKDILLCPLASQLISPLKDIPLPAPRPGLTNSKFVLIQYQFRNISTYQYSQKYYSEPIIMHGFELYCFLQLDRLDTQSESIGPENLTLVAFFRCICKVLPLEKAYLLPVNITLLMLGSGHNNEKQFPVMKITFQSSTKVVGVKLSDENWNMVLYGRSSYVVNDSLRLVVKIELLDHIDPETVAQ
jgi:hypothetical protein